MRKSNKWMVLLATGLAGFLATVDFTIVNTCLRVIQNDLHASNTSLQWVMASFGIAFSALMVPTGRIADLKGRRRVFYTTIVLFLFASLGAGFSHTLSSLVVMRFLQGLTGAAIFPSAMSIAADAFPEKEQARALAIFGSLLGIGLAAGPVIGGFVATLLGWRWIFFINVPTILLCLLIGFPYIRESKLADQNDNRIDWWGALALIVALFGLLIFLNEAPVYGWQNLWVIAALVVGLCATVILLFVESRVPSPLIPFRYFNNKTFAVALLYFIATISVAWAVIFICPLYLVHLRHYNMVQVGWTLCIMTAVTAIAPSVTGYFFHHFNKKLVIHSGYLITLVSLLSMTFFHVNSPFFIVVIAFFLFGIAWGTGNAIPIPVALSGNTQHAGLFSGALLTIGNICGVIFLTLSTAGLWIIDRSRFTQGLGQSLGLPYSVKQHLSASVSAPHAFNAIIDTLNVTQQHVIRALSAESFAVGFSFAAIFLSVVVLICWLLSAWLMRGQFRITE